MPSENKDVPPPAPGLNSGDSSAPRKIRILLAEDHKLLREGLAEFLNEEADLEVVGEAKDGMEAVELAAQLQPDVVLMDVTMPRLNGIEATRRITAAWPGICVIGLAMHEEAGMAGAMRAAGAIAYRTKGGPPQEILNTIRTHVPTGPDRGTLK